MKLRQRLLPHLNTKSEILPRLNGSHDNCGGLWGLVGLLKLLSFQGFGAVEGPTTRAPREVP